MRSSVTGIDTGRTRQPKTSTIRVQRTSQRTSADRDPSNNSSHRSTLNRQGAADVPPIPPRSRPTNMSQTMRPTTGGIHSNTNANRQNNRPNLSSTSPINSTSNGNSGASNVESGRGARGSSVRNSYNSDANSRLFPNQPRQRRVPYQGNNDSLIQRPQVQRNNDPLVGNNNSENRLHRNDSLSNGRRANNANSNSSVPTNQNPIHPRPPPPTEIIRQARIHRNTVTNQANAPPVHAAGASSSPPRSNPASATTSSSSNAPSILTPPREAAQPPAPSPNPRNPPAIRSNAPATTNSTTTTTNTTTSNPSSSYPVHSSPVDNVGNSREPQVVVRRPPAVPQPPIEHPPRATTNTNTTSNTQATHTNLNTNNNASFTTRTNTNANASANASVNVNANHTNNGPQQQNVGTITSRLQQQRERAQFDDPDERLAIFDELFTLLDSFPTNLVPFLPLMFESTFGPFLESVIPLYLAHVERQQLAQAINISMQEAAQPRSEPPKKMKLVNHIIDAKNVRDQESCIVCQENFKLNEKTVMLKCGHFFHNDCIMPWFIDHHTCPTCRTNIDEENTYS
ncbi:hypothetical protein TRFO_30427 [Tritrichomonas foetus]|uniref:RING-type domain-containing protein n=1 Tax=Tritrichomonas foetus TaxID=1144522 RepID=A0A1J4JY52_9EUKA|nr:hypothetical protein TRFO_30427 [Tritrichomonas foetus]|eukprot:OHT02438.1 hypothetical protein TRFO_30427 [Tritrichomonas foetus]